MVGARRGEPRDLGSRPRRHGAQRGSSYPVEGAARLGIGPPVVLVWILPRAGGRDAAGRAHRRPLRTQEGPPHRPRDVRSRVGCILVFDVRHRVHGSPCPHGTCRGRGHRDGDLGTHDPVQQGRETEGSGDLGGGQLPCPPDRPHPGWLAAHSLLVGLGVPDQRAGRLGRPGGGRRPGAGVAGPPNAQAWTSRGLPSRPPGWSP